jgi:hypothetical protein
MTRAIKTGQDNCTRGDTVATWTEVSGTPAKPLFAGRTKRLITNDFNELAAHRQRCSQPEKSVRNLPMSPQDDVNRLVTLATGDHDPQPNFSVDSGVGYPNPAMHEVVVQQSAKTGAK